MRTIASRTAGLTAAWLGALVLLVGCGGGEGKSDTTDTGVKATDSAAPRDTSGGAGGAGGAKGAPPAGATAAMVAEGDSIFRGTKGGGTCFTCHGPDANGTPLAPSLTDTTWRTGDGSYAFIQQRVTQGVPNPTAPYTAPMPPKGGAPLTDDQVKAVSAYVYAISHR